MCRIIQAQLVQLVRVRQIVQMQLVQLVRVRQIVQTQLVRLVIAGFRISPQPDWAMTIYLQWLAVLFLFLCRCHCHCHCRCGFF